VIQDRVAELTGMLRGTPVLRVHSHPELLIQGGEKAFARPGDETFRTAVSASLGTQAGHSPVGGSPEGSMTETGYRTSQRPIEPQQSNEELQIQQVVARLQSNPAAQGAEITPQGDLVHYVIYPGETLSIIARWYTHDRANSGRIARINDLKNPDHLEIGDSIIVPSYLLKTQSRFSETDLNQLLSISPH
jgi:nucleoid-associated protein YgaU